MFARPISFVNARVVTDEGVAGSIRFGSRILEVGAPPKRGDAVVDLQGAIVLPGLVNAHDHLELNHYGRIADGAPYANVSEWIADMRGRLAHDRAMRAAQAHPLSARLFIGLLKNLLAGVTTVAHHNPLYRELRARRPIRVVRRYGWAHSFLLAAQPAGARGEPGGDVARRFRATPANAPFIVHLAEGVDDDARGSWRDSSASGPRTERRARPRRRHRSGRMASGGAKRRGRGVVSGVESISVRRTGSRSDRSRRNQAASRLAIVPIHASLALAICSTSCATPHRSSRCPRARCAW
jgi:hypothetical protein